MIDLARAAVIATIPLLAAVDTLTVGWIYAVAFCSATLTIAFDAAEFAAIPSLVPSDDDLVAANGRVQASWSGGPGRLRAAAGRAARHGGAGPAGAVG